VFGGTDLRDMFFENCVTDRLGGKMERVSQPPARKGCQKWR
jgi:hypothetical protein